MMGPSAMPRKLNGRKLVRNRTKITPFGACKHQNYLMIVWVVPSLFVLCVDNSLRYWIKMLKAPGSLLA
jgi:hypothetical protein